MRAQTERAQKQAGPVFPALPGWAPYALICLAAALLYWRTCGFGFVYLDDNRLAEDAGAFARLSALPGFFSKDAFLAAGKGSFYRPLLNVTFLLDSLRGGAAPGAYHATNLLLHAAASCLFFRLLGALGFSGAAPLFWALLFAAHPGQVQAVAWIYGRNDPLLAVFALSSFLAFLAWLERPGPGRLAAHLLLLALALFTKENALMLVPLCAAYMRFLRRPGAPGGAVWLWAGWAAAASVWAAARTAALGNFGGDAPLDAAASLAANWPALFAYLGKAFFPVRPAILPVLKDLSPWHGAAAAALLAGLFAVSKSGRRGLAAFGLAWFALFLLPTLVQSSASVPNFSEHRLYLPLAGLLAALAALDPAAALRLPGRPAAAAAAGLLLVFGWRAYAFSGNFRDRVSFWEAAAASSPSSAFNANNLGAIRYLEKDPAGAEAWFLAAKALNPAEPRVHGNLGLLYMETGRADSALPEFLEEARIDPANANNYLNLGLLYYSKGLPDKAEAAWQAALALEPGLCKASHNLAVLCLRRGDPAGAGRYVGQLARHGCAVSPALAADLAAFGEKSR